MVTTKKEEWWWKTPSSSSTGQVTVLKGDEIRVPALPKAQHATMYNPALIKSDDWASKASWANYKGYTDFLHRISVWLPQSVYF
jgi:hypothetical protein